MVAEVVPERRRIEAGALLYTSAPMGLFLATFINFQIAGRFFKGQPEVSWRYVFLSGLLPAAVALAIRFFVREPERWQKAASSAPPPRLADLFSKEVRAITLSGFSMAVIALIAWWSCNAFLPVVATGLAQSEAQLRALDPPATQALIEGWKKIATNYFNWGGSSAPCSPSRPPSTSAAR